MARLGKELAAALDEVAAALAPAGGPEEEGRPDHGYLAGLCWLAYSATGEARFRAAGTAAAAAWWRGLGAAAGAAAPDLGLVALLAAVSAWRLTGDALARSVAFAAARLLGERFHPPPAACLDGQVSGPGLLNLPLLFWAAAESGHGRPLLLALRHLHSARERLDPAGTAAPWAALGFGLAYGRTGDPADLQAARAAAGAILARGAPARLAPVAVAGLLEVAGWLGPEGAGLRAGARRLLAQGPGAGLDGRYFYLAALLRLQRGLRPAWAAP